MKFENKGKWLKEAQNKMAARDTMEDPDFLDDDDEVLTFEEEELDIENNDIEEEPAQKNEAVKIPANKMPYRVTTNGAGGKSLEFQYATLDKAKKDADAFRKNGGTAIIRFIYKDENDKIHTEVVSESAQKNEAKIERDYDINFDNVGGGLTVEKVAITNGYGIELSGYSSNTSKKLTYVHPTLSNDRGKSQDEIEKNYDALNAKRTAIAKDLKPLADKFDKDIEAVFAKHGFKKA